MFGLLGVPSGFLRIPSDFFRVPLGFLWGYVEVPSEFHPVHLRAQASQLHGFLVILVLSLSHCQFLVKSFVGINNSAPGSFDLKF
jgi:hypothetical protein